MSTIAVNVNELKAVMLFTGNEVVNRFNLDTVFIANKTMFATDGYVALYVERPELEAPIKIGIKRQILDIALKAYPKSLPRIDFDILESGDVLIKTFPNMKADNIASSYPDAFFLQCERFLIDAKKIETSKSVAQFNLDHSAKFVKAYKILGLKATSISYPLRMLPSESKLMPARICFKDCPHINGIYNPLKTTNASFDYIEPEDVPAEEPIDEVKEPINLDTLRLTINQLYTDLGIEYLKRITFTTEEQGRILEAELRRQIELQPEVVDYEDEINEKDDEIEELKNSKNELENDIEEKEAEIDSLKDRIAKLESGEDLV